MPGGAGPPSCTRPRGVQRAANARGERSQVREEVAQRTVLMKSARGRWRLQTQCGHLGGGYSHCSEMGTATPNPNDELDDRDLDGDREDG